MGDFGEDWGLGDWGLGLGFLGFSGLGEPPKQVCFGIFRFYFSCRRCLRARPSIRPSLPI